MMAIDWPGIVGTVARALLGEPSSRIRTELRYGRKGSLAVHVDGERVGTWHDFEAGEGGGVLDLVRHVHQCDKAAARAWLDAEGFIERGPGRPALTRPESRCEPCAVETGNRNPPGTAAHAAEDARCEAARRIWKATRPLAGTVAEAYLDARGVGHVAGAAALGFHPALSHPTAPGRFPVLVAGVQDVAGRFMGIQRTYLDGSRKAAVAPVRASLGNPAGGAVRLAESVDGRLLLGEGIETTAAAVLVLDWQGGAWATLGTSGLKAVKLPEHVRDVVIAADRDAKGGGQLAAAALAERLMDEGRSVAIELPPFVGDWCGVLREAL